MWLNSVSLGRFEVAGWGHPVRFRVYVDAVEGCATLMKVQAVDVCGNDGGDAGLYVYPAI